MRILAIDYGRKKCGLAVTDPLRLIATALETVPTHRLFDWLDAYLAREEVSDLVVGEPLTAAGQPNPILNEIVGFERKFAKKYPGVGLHRQDEYGTSVRAKKVMVASGMKQKKRRDKTEVDRLAAALILQDYIDETP